MDATTTAAVNQIIAETWFAATLTGDQVTVRRDCRDDLALELAAVGVTATPTATGLCLKAEETPVSRTCKAVWDALRAAGLNNVVVSAASWSGEGVTVSGSRFGGHAVAAALRAAGLRFDAAALGRDGSTEVELV